MGSRVFALGCVLCLAIAGCSDEDGGSGGGAGTSGSAGSAGSAGSGGLAGSGGGAGSAGSAGSEWAACAYDPSDGSGTAQCRVFELPLDYSDPGGEKIGIAVKRKPATGTSTGQLWLLHGGPGASGIDDMPSLAHSLPSERPDLDIYTLDHRGVGGSGRLSCPDQEATTSEGGAVIVDGEWPACIATLEGTWGAALNQITMSNSARDVGALIELTREPGKSVFVWGGSYGTRLAVTYISLFPEQPSGVILEGITPPGQGFEDYDVDLDAVAQLVFAECAKHAGCSSRLGPDPFAKATAVVQSFDSGHCPTLAPDAGTIRAFLGALLFYQPIRDYLPAVVYRMERCNSADIAAIVKLSEVFGAIATTPFGAVNDGMGGSRPLFYHVAISDLWGLEATPTPAQAQAEWEKLTVSTGLGVDIAERAETWPVYPSDGLSAQIPAYDGPLLMLQGGLDGPTPLADALALKAAYSGANQTFVEISLAAHNVVGGSPTKSGTDCGLDVYLQFLADPAATLDTSCTSDLAPIDFDGDPSWTPFLLGTNDVWGD